jgi:hypothetical protein
MKEKLNSPIQLRPRFTIDFKENSEVIIQKFTKSLKEQNTKFPSRFYDGHISIDVPKKEDHFWSPQLNIEVIAVDETTSLDFVYVYPFCSWNSIFNFWNYALCELETE